VCVCEELTGKIGRSQERRECIISAASILC
jgi:hypothetical protein